MNKQIFLGGACGSSNWRTDIAIPILERAGVSYYNPQLTEGAWTPAHQYAEMDAKTAADVWLFVLNDQTRGVASIGEVAYRIGQNGKLALALNDLNENSRFEGRVPDPREIDDLNRGRVFLRAMAKTHGIPVFESIAAATEYAVQLARQAGDELNEAKLAAIVERVQVPGYAFLCGRIGGKLTVQIRKEELDYRTGTTEPMTGRTWLIEPQAREAEVVRTLLKAALTWEEHELRERFRFDGAQLFTPHFQTPHVRDTCS